MKAVIHIFEIVVVALVMFIALMQFSYIPRMETDWAGNKLSLKGWDVLFTLDEKGINWLDPAEVEDHVGRVLNDTNIQFGLTVRGAPPSEISVGCVCSTQEYAVIQGILQDLELNGEDISFDVDRIIPSEMAFPHAHDVIVVGDHDLGGHKPEILNYLEAGKGLVEIRELGAGDMDSVQSEVFGLEWNDSVGSGSGNISFTSYPSAQESYIVYKYFHSVPNSSGQTYPGGYEFQNFLDPSSRVCQGDGDSRRVVLAEEDTGRPACTINYGVSGGFGRTAWLHGAVSGLGDDQGVLARSLVMWAAGREYDVVESDIMSGIAEFSFFKVLDQDMHQPIEIIMVMGYIY